MSVSILVVDDEPDVAELFRQRFRPETRHGTSCITQLRAEPLDGETGKFRRNFARELWL